jgi:N-acetylglucosamine malate deacetylase 2
MKYFINLLFLLLPFCIIAQKDQTILVILAHPDDETAFGSVLSKLSEVNKVHLLVGLDGRFGATEHAGIPPGDDLAKLRAKELECSCNKLGMEPPIMLGFHDGVGIAGGMGEYFRQSKKLREDIKQKIEELKPDFIITHGPEGDTGHSDHRVVGSMVTEILLREGWVDKFPLYFLAWTEGQSHSLGGLGYLSKQYLNVGINYTDAHEQKNWDALKCHWSQFTEDDLKEFMDSDKSDVSNTIYFRKFAIDKSELRSEF